jgi:hypothetical protein
MRTPPVVRHKLPCHPILCRPRFDHPDDHPDDPSGSVGSRLDRRGIQREQARSVWSRSGRRGESGPALHTGPLIIRAPPQHESDVGVAAVARPRDPGRCSVLDLPVPAIEGRGATEPELPRWRMPGGAQARRASGDPCGPRRGSRWLHAIGRPDPPRSWRNTASPLSRSPRPPRRRRTESGVLISGQDQQHVDHGIDRLPGGVTLEVGQRVRSRTVGAGGQDS